MDKFGDETPSDVARNIQRHINQIQEHMVDVAMLMGDEWPDIDGSVDAINKALVQMTAVCDKVRGE
jgi:hypothetical protein